MSPGLCGSRMTGWLMLLPQQEEGMGRRGYPAEFRYRVLDLVATGRRVRGVAGDLGTSDQMRYSWPKQEPIHQGIEPGVTAAERAELAAAQPPQGDRA